jgi:predicted AlkP superfamily phosphohydrolase/phosphomutase
MISQRGGEGGGGREPPLWYRVSRNGESSIAAATPRTSPRRTA